MLLYCLLLLGGADYLLLWEYEEQYPDNDDRPPWSSNEWQFIILASNKLADRARGLENTQIGRMQHVYVVEEIIDGIPEEVQWKPKARTSDDGYLDAQSRQLEYMKYVGIDPGVRWIIFMDDDTWVNINALRDMLEFKDPDVPTLFSYLHVNAHVINSAYPCGGAGMVLSRKASDLLRPKVLTDECPLLKYNDLTLGLCAIVTQIHLVHVPEMRCTNVPPTHMQDENWMDVMGQISFHRMVNSFDAGDIDQTLYHLREEALAVVRLKCRFSTIPRNDTVVVGSLYFGEKDFLSLAKACGVTTIRPTTISLHFRLINESFTSPSRVETRRKMAYQRPYNGRWPEYFSFFRTINIPFEAKWVQDVEDAVDSSSEEPCAWTFIAFKGVGTWVNVVEANRTLSEISSLWGCDNYGPAAADDSWDLFSVPPLALAYRHTERHIELNSGLFLNGVAIRRLRASSLENTGTLDEDFHHNPYKDPKEWQKMQDHLHLSVNLMHWVINSGIMLLHFKRMAPDWGCFWAYSTERRPQASNTVSFLTVGHVDKSATLRYSLTSTVLSRYHANRDPSEAETTLVQTKRAICRDLNCTDGSSPGALHLGNIIQFYRSEHFLPDAMATDSPDPS